MKRITIILFTLLAYFMTSSCDVEAEFIDFIPKYPLTNMVKSAKATIGDETVNGTVDNSNHTISFVFNNNSDFTNVTVSIDFSSRAILKDNAEKEFTADLKSGYTFVVNNEIEDFTYSISATKASIVQIDRTKCSVVTGLENDADPAKINLDELVKAEHLFDGKWISKKEAYKEVDYKHFGWTMKSLTGENGEQFGDAYTVDLGDEFKVARMTFRPYYSYTGNAGALYEIYAFTGTGNISGDWAMWTLIATVDDSAKWEIVKNAEPGSAEDLTGVGTTVEFKYGDVPASRYYRVKIIKNFYAYYQTAMDQYWAGRTHWYSLSELEVWKYNIDSDNK